MTLCATQRDLCSSHRMIRLVPCVLHKLNPLQTASQRFQIHRKRGDASSGQIAAALRHEKRCELLCLPVSVNQQES